MPATNESTINIRKFVKQALRDEAEPLWFPRLAGPLTQIAWDRLQRETGLGPNSYGTSRLLLGDSGAERLIVAWCKPDTTPVGDGSLGAIPVEILAARKVRQIIGGSVQFLDISSISGEIVRQLDQALSFLGLVPTVWPTVCKLVRTLHIIDSGDHDIDVSFSDPTLPLSIFVSVPLARPKMATFRIAEAILHEAMHLHLTLVSRVVPLVQPQGKMYYSPWRGEERDSEGILQALYVFSVIRSFFVSVPMIWSNETSGYIPERMEHIEWQIMQAKGFEECDELTPEGAALAIRLLSITK